MSRQFHVRATAAYQTEVVADSAADAAVILGDAIRAAQPPETRMQIVTVDVRQAHGDEAT